MGVGSSGDGDAVGAGSAVKVGGTAVSVTVGVNVGDGVSVGVAVGASVGVASCVGERMMTGVDVTRAKAAVSLDFVAGGAAAGGSGRGQTAPSKNNSNNKTIKIAPGLVFELK